MKFILVDPNPAICNAWREHFQPLSDIDIVNDYFESLPDFDCMVSAANSFGLMDGGVDLAITRYFGDDLMLRVQERIIAEYFGEQPVGTCMIVETGHPQHPYIAHTPTMRVPMAIAYTDHAYLAMWALLRELHRHNQTAERKIEIVACPALGTGYGRVPAREAARQMALAYRNFIYPPKEISWPYAGDRQAKIGFGGDDGLRQSNG
ncbi:MAG: macro domain-containing protein [Chloroflexota bacterium]